MTYKLRELSLNSIELELTETAHTINVVTDVSSLDNEQYLRLKRNGIHFSQQLDSVLWIHHDELKNLDEFWFVNWEDEVEDFMHGVPMASIQVDMEHDIRLARAWLVRQLVWHFRGMGWPCKRDFIGRVLAYRPLPEEETSRCWVYQQYAFNPRHGDQRKGWQLDVMPLGKSVVSKTPITQLPLGGKAYSVIAGHEVLKNKFVEDRHWAKCNNGIYPITNREINNITGCGPKHYRDDSKYVTKNKAFADIVNTVLSDESFARALAIKPLTMANQISVAADNVFAIAQSAKELLTGSPNAGQYLRSKFSFYGCHAKPKEEYTYFFIYPVEAIDKVHVLQGMLAKGNENLEIKNMTNYAHQQPIWERGLSFAYTEGINSMPQIVEKLKSERFANNKRFMAIVLTNSKESAATEDERQFYYDLKLELLRKGIVSQAICVDTIKNDKSFKYIMDNLAAAIVAKQGGKPWVLANPSTSRDLIVGVGASHSRKEGKAYLGSAFYFDFLGNFYKFDCCEEQHLEALRHSITNAIVEFIGKREATPDRLIIHYYKTMNKRESRAVEQSLHELKLKCPVYVVNMVDATEEDLIAFDMQFAKLMPISGTYIRLRQSEYLLYCNERYDEGATRVNKVQFPIKLTVTKGANAHDEKALSDVEHEIITQAYQFCRLYYRSVATQNKPITIAYTELFAKAASNSRKGELKQFGNCGLWMI